MAITVDPNEPFHVLLGAQVTPVSLEVLDALYQDDTIEEATLIWQQGLGQWLRLDVVLAELEKQEPGPAQQREVEPDSYYVSFGDNDVRLLSLEQLDKFYDLEVIDDATLVWQPGFVEWIPLALLIGEADAPPVSIHPSLGPQQATQRPASMAPLPSAVPGSAASSSAASSSAGLPRPSSVPAPRSAPPPRSSSPASRPFEAPVPQGFASTQAFAATQSFAAPQAFASAPASRPPGSASHAPSVRPLSLSPNSTQALTFTAPPPPAKASPWFGRGLMAACFFVGLFVVQRNGVMMQLAAGAGQEQSWQKVEASVGGTSVDTPQGLAAWLSDLSTRHGLASLTPTEPVAPPPQVEGSLKLTPLPPASPAAETRPSSPTASPGQPSLTASTATQASDVAEKMRAKLAGEPERAPVVSRPQARPAKTSARKKKSGGADAYDPMNGTL